MDGVSIFLAPRLVIQLHILQRRMMLILELLSVRLGQQPDCNKCCCYPAMLDNCMECVH
jgi:hypothetical protein